MIKTIQHKLSHIFHLNEVWIGAQPIVGKPKRTCTRCFDNKRKKGFK